MKEIVEIVRTCGYDFKEVPGTLGKHQTSASMLESSTNGPLGGAVREKANLDAIHGDQPFNQTALDEFAYSAPHKRRKRELELWEDMALASEPTGSVIVVDVHGPLSDEQSQLQTQSSANATSSAQINNDRDLQSCWAEVGNPNGQSEQIDSFPDMDFGLSRKTHPPDTYNDAPHEPQASFLDTLDSWSPFLLTTDPDSQATDLNDVDTITYWYFSGV